MVFFHHSISVTHHFKIPHPFSTITHLPLLNIFHIVCGIHTCHSVQYFFFFSTFLSSFFVLQFVLFSFFFFFSLFAFLISDFSSRSKLNIHKYILEQTQISQSLKKKKKSKRKSAQAIDIDVAVAAVVAVVGFRVFKEWNVGNDWLLLLLLSELGHLRNGLVMVFWSTTDLTRAALANTPRPIAS